jgi:hypothetical protein
VLRTSPLRRGREGEEDGPMMWTSRRTTTTTMATMTMMMKTIMTSRVNANIVMEDEIARVGGNAEGPMAQFRGD